MRRAAAILALLAIAGCDLLYTKHHGSNEAAAIGALRTISIAQTYYRDGLANSQARGAYAPTLAALGAANLIDATLASGAKQGYSFRIFGVSKDRFCAVASPTIFGRTGDRAFFVDESGIIRFTVDGSAPTAQSRPVGG